MSKPVVLIAEELSPATIAALGPDFEVRSVDGADRSALLPALVDVDAVLVRSATKMDAEALSVAKKLKVIARAGVGLDNVDIKAATAAGVMVVNAPTSNITSAAELAIGHLLSLARQIPAANDSLKSGQWKRSSFNGVELFEKTVGIIGLGRIGSLVASRLAAFGTEIIAYDPYLTAARAQQMGVRSVSLDELLAESDFITIHIPKTPETVGLIGAAEFAKAKPNLRIVNASRGGIIDEDALYDALKNNVIAGAGLDVFNQEPPSESPLLSLPNIIVTPHLGASTDEAQEKAGIAVAKSVRLALSGELVPDAVNVAGGVINPLVRPGIPLAEKLGQVFAGLAHLPLVSVDVEVSGEIAEFDVSVLKLASLKGIFTNLVSENVSYVNAPLFAEQRGLEVRMISNPVSEEYRNLVTLRGVLSDGQQISVSGTLTGTKFAQKIVGMNGYDVEMPFAPHLIVFSYTDRPGVVALYGKLLGEAGINIAGMQIARRALGGQALSILTIDSPLSDELVERLGELVNADVIRQINITEG
ncbi:MAG: phosphoglycerate dehydrogenase [Microbacteriaceae bacterium]